MIGIKKLCLKLYKVKKSSDSVVDKDESGKVRIHELGSTGYLREKH